MLASRVREYSRRCCVDVDACTVIQEMRGDPEALTLFTAVFLEEILAWKTQETLLSFLREHTWPSPIRTLFWNGGPLDRFVVRCSTVHMDAFGIRILTESVQHGAAKARLACSTHSCLRHYLGTLHPTEFVLFCEFIGVLSAETEARECILDDGVCRSMSVRMAEGDAVMHAVLAVFLEGQVVSYGKCYLAAEKAAHALIGDFTRVPVIENHHHLQFCLKFMEHLALRVEWHVLMSDWVVSLSRYGWPSFFGTLLAHMLSTPSMVFLIELHRRHKLDFLIRKAQVHAETNEACEWRVVRGRLRVLWPTRVCEVLNQPPSAGFSPTTEYECPITLQKCVNPAVASDGHTYERDALLRHLAAHDTPLSPVTKAPLTLHLFDNFAIRTR